MDKIMLINCKFKAEVELLNLIIKHKIPLSAFQPLMEWAKNSKFQPNYPTQKRETVLNDMYKHLELNQLSQFVPYVIPWLPNKNPMTS